VTSVAVLVKVEMAKQFRRPRTYLTLGALALFDVALVVALVVTGSHQQERVGDIPLFLVPATGAWTSPVIALASTMKFFLPLAVAIFAGDAVAGEAGWGSLRYLLARPVSRSRVLLSKAVVALMLSAMALLVIPVVAVLAGVVAFGWHPLVVVDGAASTRLHDVTVVFGTGAALGRLALSTAFIGAGMTSIFAFAFFLSTLTTRSFAAVAGGVGLTIVSRVLNADYLPGVAVINPYMPNNGVDLWQHWLQRPSPTDGMSDFLLLQLGYVVVFGGLAWWVFVTRDKLA
jgi:ABC-2 type transport system permease protein